MEMTKLPSRTCRSARENETLHTVQQSDNINMTWARDTVLYALLYSAATIATIDEHNGFSLAAGPR